MNVFSIGVAIGAAALVTSASFANSIDETSAMFGLMPAMTNARLSPGGDKVIFIDRSRSQRAVKVADVDSGDVNVVYASSETDNVSDCFWLNQERIGCNLYQTMVLRGDPHTVWRIFAMDLDGGNAQMLGQENEEVVGYNIDSGSIIDFLPDDPDHVLMSVYVNTQSNIGSRISRDETGLSVHRVNVDRNSSTTVERANLNVAGYW
ncbi:MAG: hypothetical protein WA906_01970, partial [Pacificimonas sp.]